MTAKQYAEPKAPPPIALPKLVYLNQAPLDDTREKAAEMAAQFNEKRIIRRGVDAWAVVKKAESFDGWKAIGAALAIGRNHALRASGAAAPIGQNYSRAFSQWLDRTGFPQMPKPLRSWALDLDQNILAITEWRATLSDRERRRLTNPQSIVRRWRKDTAPVHEADQVDVLQAASAALGRFLACMELLGPDEAAPLWRHVCEKAAAARKTGTVN